MWATSSPYITYRLNFLRFVLFTICVLFGSETRPSPSYDPRNDNAQPTRYRSTDLPFPAVPHQWYGSWILASSRKRSTSYSRYRSEPPRLSKSTLTSNCRSCQNFVDRIASFPFPLPLPWNPLVHPIRNNIHHPVGCSSFLRYVPYGQNFKTHLARHRVFPSLSPCLRGI